MIARMSGNREIYYQSTGAGPEILLVHGGLPAFFDELVDVMSPHYRCIAFDRLGFGKSLQPNRDSTVAEQVAAIEAVHREVTSAPAWVFGHSSGGNFALAYALAHPQRVKGLLLVEPALNAVYSADERPVEVERLHKVVMPLFWQGKVEQGWQAFLAAIFPGESSPSLSEEALDLVRSFSYDLQRSITWCPSPAELRQVTRPALLLMGDQSPFLFRDICQRLHSQLSNSELRTLAGQNHQMPFAAPKLVAEQVIAFMSENESKT